VGGSRSLERYGKRRAHSSVTVSAELSSDATAAACCHRRAGCPFSVRSAGVGSTSAKGAIWIMIAVKLTAKDARHEFTSALSSRP
jgi:hypothetical protein